MGLFDTGYDLGGGYSQAINPMQGFSGLVPQLPVSDVIPAASGGAGGWSNLLFGGKDANGMTTNGMAGSVLGIAQGLGNAYMGMKQFGLAKDALKQSKKQFEKNYAAQKATTNASMEDRQRARVASNAGAYESVGSYMNRNGIA